LRPFCQQDGCIPEIDTEFLQFATRYPRRSSMGLDPALPDVPPDNLRIVTHKESEFLGRQNGWESRCHARSIAHSWATK
jgi:hypothetical protein